MSGMNPGFAAYLAKKNHNGGMPAGGVNNTAMQSLNNTKAPMTKQVPSGKPHAKVLTSKKKKH